MSVLTRLSNAWKALTKPDDASMISAPISQDVVPVKEKNEETLPHKAERFWVSDEQLRALAQDSRDKTTHWVIAGDFEELFKWIDSFNEGKDGASLMKLEVSDIFHENLKKLRAERIHGDSVNALSGGTRTIVITGKNVQKVFGPTFIGNEDMRLTIGGSEIPAYYKGSIMDNTSINFLIDNQWHEIEFGMGHIPEFFGGQRQALLEQGRPAPLTPEP